MLTNMFDKAWFERHQKPLVWFSNTFIGRYILRINGSRSSIGKNKIVKILPNVIFWGKGKKYVAEFRTHNKFSKRLFYAFYPLWYLLHLWDTLFANNFQPAWNLGFDTLTVYPDPNPESTSVDGYASRGPVDETFSTIRTSAGQTGSDTDTSEVHAGLLASGTSDQFRDLRRSFYLFDTSALTALATVSAAVLSVFGNAKANAIGSLEMDIVASTPASNTAIVAADYSQLGSTPFASITYANFSTSAYNDFTLDANGIADVSLTGISKYGARTNWDTDNSFGGVWSSLVWSNFQAYYADQGGTTNDPKLVVTYSAPGGTLDLTSKIW